MVTKNNNCKDCGKLIWSNASRCRNCDYKARRQYFLGEQNPFFGKQHIPATREKMVANHKHHKSWLGRHHTEYTKILIGEKSRGRRMSQESRKKISIAMKNRVLSETHKQRLGIASKNRQHPKGVLKHTDDFKRRLSERNCSNWQDQEYIDRMKNKLWNTKPEQMMKQILSNLGLSYYHCRKIAGINHSYPADFYLPELNCVIEVDGKYWHNYPYDNEIDHIRTTEMQEAGYRVLRFWENEFDLNIVKEKIMEVRA